MVARLIWDQDLQTLIFNTLTSHLSQHFYKTQSCQSNTVTKQTKWDFTTNKKQNTFLFCTSLTRSLQISFGIFPNSPSRIIISLRISHFIGFGTKPCATSFASFFLFHLSCSLSTQGHSILLERQLASCQKRLDSVQTHGATYVTFIPPRARNKNALFFFWESRKKNFLSKSAPPKPHPKLHNVAVSHLKSNSSHRCSVPVPLLLVKPRYHWQKPLGTTDRFFATDWSNCSPSPFF